MKYILPAVVPILVLLTACATVPAVPEQTLEQRAQIRWDALIARDFEAAYEYLSPGYRQRNSVADYSATMAGRPVIWLEANVVGVECETDVKCSVQTDVRYRVPSGPTGINQLRMNRIIKETWLFMNDGWWYSMD